MNKILFILLMFFSTYSYAYFDFGVGYSLSTKNSLEEEIATRNIVGAQMSYDWYDINIGLEVNYFSEDEWEEGFASVSQTYLDLIPWARYNFINTDSIDLFFGVGSGGYQETVEAKVNGAGNFKDKSDINWLLSGALGIKAKIGWFSGVVEYRISRRVPEDLQDQSLRLSTNISF